MGPSCKRLLVAHDLPGEGLATRGAFTSFLPSCGGAGVTPPDPSPKRKEEGPPSAGPFCDCVRPYACRVGQMPRAACFTNTCCRAAHPTPYGAVAERLKAAVLKTAGRIRPVGPNPTRSSSFQRFCSSIGYLLWWIANASCFRVCRPPAQAPRRHRSSLSGSLSASPRCCGLKLGWSRLSGAQAPA